MTNEESKRLKAAAELLRAKGYELSSAAKRLVSAETCRCDKPKDIDDLCDKCYLEHHHNAYFKTCEYTNGTR